MPPQQLKFLFSKVSGCKNGSKCPAQPTSSEKKDPEFFYCLQTATLSTCEKECDQMCSNAEKLGKMTENCIVNGKSGCEIQGPGCEGPFYKCSCSVELLEH